MNTYTLLFVCYFFHGASAWVPMGQTLNAPSVDDNAFGSVLKLSGDGQRMLVGNPDYKGGAGAVRLHDFDQANGTWIEAAALEGDAGEQLGSQLALSSDGSVFAIADRKHARVHAFNFNTASMSVSPLGSVLSACSDAVTSLNLVYTTASDGKSETYYLSIGCAKDDASRGKVQILELVTSTKGEQNWVPFLEELNGGDQGDYFGTDVALTGTGSSQSNILRIAVSSPKALNSRGTVRIFVSTSTKWVQMGSDVVGEQIGELLGTSLDMSTTTQPFLVVGSPGHRQQGEFNPHGKVQLFHWRSLNFGVAPSWTAVGQSIMGLGNRDQFGVRVTMARDGSRIVATSKAHDQNRGYYRVFDLDTYDSLKPVGNPFYGTGHGVAVDADIAINEMGSTVALGSPNETTADGNSGIVRVWVDDTPFCQLPDEVTGGYRSTLASYQSRALCRSGLNLISEAQDCSLAEVFAHGQMVSCQWESLPLQTFLSSKSPTSAPSGTVNEELSEAPTEAHSEAPSDVPSGPPSENRFSQVFATSAPNNAVTQSPTTSYSTDMPTMAVTTASPTPINCDEAHSAAPTLEIIEAPLKTEDHGILGTYAPTSTQPQLEACACNENSVCTSKVYHSGESLSVCVTVVVPNLKIVKIDGMELQQELLSQAVIQSGTNVASGTNQTCTDFSCVMKVSVPSEFFTTGSCNRIAVKGTAITTMTQRRHLRGLSSMSYETATFKAEVSINLPSSSHETSNTDNTTLASNSSSGKRVIWLAVVTSISTMLLALGCWMKWRSRKSKA